MAARLEDGKSRLVGQVGRAARLEESWVVGQVRAARLEDGESWVVGQVGRDTREQVGSEEFLRSSSPESSRTIGPNHQHIESCS